MSDTLVALFSYNEGEKLKHLVTCFPQDGEFDLLFIDDGSSDGSYEFLSRSGYATIRHDTNRGIGFGIRDAVAYAREKGYKLIVIMAANGKMIPEEIPRLIGPLRNEGYDYVQGSRYLPGGRSPNLPIFRRVMIRIFTQLINLLTGFAGTDITCGFRAYKLSLFDNPRFRLEQAWLDTYEMEYYIHYHVLKGGYKITEAPVSMIYPESGKNYSKIKPFIGWWSMIRPWIFLTLKIRK